MSPARLRKKGFVFILLIVVIILLQTSVISKWMYPVKYESEIKHYAEQYQVDPYLMMAIIRVESKFEENRTSKKGAIGLMQIMPDTAKWAADSAGIPYQSIANLREPKTNLALGAWYLSYLDERFDGNKLAVAAAYNAGHNKVAAWMKDGTWSGGKEGIQNIPYGETRHYIQKVDYYHERYKKIYMD